MLQRAISFEKTMASSSESWPLNSQLDEHLVGGSADGAVHSLERLDSVEPALQD